MGAFLRATAFAPLILLVSCGGEAATAPPAVHAASADCEASAPCAEPVVAAARVEARLDAVTAPLLPNWEVEVRAIVVEAYDLDHSGAVDRPSEVDRILCSVWQKIDAGYRERSSQGDSVRDGYGFSPYSFYIDSLGIARNQREVLRQKLLGCGVR